MYNTSIKICKSDELLVNYLIVYYHFMMGPLGFLETYTKIVEPEVPMVTYEPEILLL